MLFKNRNNYKDLYLSNQNHINIHLNKKEDKFSILNEKINSLSDNKSFNKFKEIIETKIKEVEENFKSNIESLDQKYDILNDQFDKFSKMLEEEKLLKEQKKKKNEEELNEFEKDIKKILEDERGFLKSYVDDYLKKLEELINNHNQEKKR